MRWRIITIGTMILGLVTAGCPSAALSTPTGVAGEVVQKAEEIASQIGGQAGFGGPLMNGYRQHMGGNMGFDGMSDLADPDETMMVRLHNDSDEDCTFHLVYSASHMDLSNQTMDVTVGAGQVETVELPCAEMIGLGSMTNVGEAACEFPDGSMFDNRMCVPGFMNSDYDCAGGYDCFFGPDTDDVDADGDTGEMMATTEALHGHMGQMGMMGPAHRP